jgi:hypothetical protein
MSKQELRKQIADLKCELAAVKAERDAWKRFACPPVGVTVCPTVQPWPTSPYTYGAPGETTTATKLKAGTGSLVLT